MLVAALAATLLGFALLVLALITGVLWLAFTCIAVCAIGIFFLVADTVGVRSLRGRSRRRHTAAGASIDDRERPESDPHLEDEPTTEIPKVVDPPPSLDAVSATPAPDPEPADGRGRHERSERELSGDAAAEQRRDTAQEDGGGPAPHPSRHRRPD